MVASLYLYRKKKSGLLLWGFYRNRVIIISYRRGDCSCRVLVCCSCRHCYFYIESLEKCVPTRTILLHVLVSGFLNLDVVLVQRTIAFCYRSTYEVNNEKGF